jgi:succinoglycan biosynthesis protein ExoA
MSAENYPFVTVIMPVYNEEAFIARSLGAVLAQDYPPERFEILVVDGMSQDATRRVVQSLPNAQRVRIIDNPQRLQAAAMNIALPYAKGEVIVRVDGHTIIAPDYLRACVRALQNTGAWNVGGGMHPVGETPMGKAIAAASRSAFAVPTAFHVSQQPAYTDTVYMGAWWRWALERVGGFRSEFRYQ